MSRNPIWEYFTKAETDAGKVKCNECSKLLSLASVIPGKQTVTGLKTHLQKCNQEIFDVYMTKVNKRSAEPPNSKSKAWGWTETCAVVVASTVIEQRSQKQLDDHPPVQSIKKSIMDLLVVDMLPCTLVEGEDLKRINFADPAGPRCYEPKSEKYFRTSLTPATYDNVASCVHPLL